MKPVLHLLALLFFAAYPYVRSDAVISDPWPGGKSISVQIRLHNSGDYAASCTVKLGGQTKVTGISSAGEAVVDFEKVRNYNGYTVACQAG